MNKHIIFTLIFSLWGGAFATAQQGYSLQQCKDLVLQHSKKMKYAQLQQQKAEAVRKEAWMHHLPKVEAGFYAVQLNKKMIEFDNPSGNLPVYNGDPRTLPTATQFAFLPAVSLGAGDRMHTGNITVMQPLYAGGRIKTGNRLSELGVEVSKLQVSLSKTELIAKTESMYWQIVALDEKQKTLDAYEKLLETVLKEAKDARKAGLIDKSDVLKVGLKQSEVALNKLKLTNGRQLALMAFCQHLGIDYSKNIRLTDALPTNNLPQHIQAEAAASVPKRSEYQLLQKVVKAEEMKTQIERGHFLPEVGLGASAFYSDAMEHGSDGRLARVGVFLAARIPISNMWSKRHSLKKHILGEKMAQNKLDETKELLKLQIQKTYYALTESAQAIALGQKKVAQHEEFLQTIKDRHKAGVVPLSKLLEAQADVQKAKSEYIDALSHYHQQVVAYKKATAQYE
ncbi:TolC family protein [Microscilla marina]|uniref:Outer membrane efflux protein n=1 Tax=Microscilla marina ATCC 23134 TaxID=313606 RepID=A1ZW03_MICM2|nr:TolC family protein [Microscilla marina]EAY25366.1 outer membrane efflux protein [Microscilla marina ATCC 23134]